MLPRRLVKRRELIMSVGGTAVLWPFSVRADVSRPRPLITWCSGLSQESAAPVVGAFKDGLRELGYNEGVNIGVV
jgi:hypothetical protein